MLYSRLTHASLYRLVLCCCAFSLLLLGACTREQPENQSGNLTVTTSANDVYAGIGSLVTLTATGQQETDKISWSLSGVGSLSATSGSSVQYAPPASIPNEDSVTVSASLNGGDPARVTIKLHPAAPFTLLAGNIGGAGSLDSKSPLAARFYGPSAVALDIAGNAYVADTANHAIRKFSITGEVTTLAGSPGLAGSSDGLGSTARFYEPRGIAVDAARNVYVSDSHNHTIRKITPDGQVSTLAGQAGYTGNVDGNGADARFFNPTGIAIDTVGNLYVSDTANHILRKIRADGAVSTLAGQAGVRGSNDGFGVAARFDSPQAIAVDKAGNIYVAEASNIIRKVAPSGLVSTLAGSAGQQGSADGTGSAARFYQPLGLAVDTDGNLFVADAFNATIRKISAAGVVSTVAGAVGLTGSVDGVSSAARFYLPAGLASDAANNVYVADSGSNTLRRITAQGQVITVAGAAGIKGSADGVGAAAQFNGQRDLATDAAGNVYVADSSNATIRKITSAGVVTTLAGQAGATGSNDGLGSAARFSSPQSVAVDKAGNVYVADTFNSTIRKITPAGQVSTLAGKAGVPLDQVDGTGANARFYLPQGITTDSNGNIYVTDTVQYKLTAYYSAVIRKITPDGVVTTLAGQAGVRGSSDGTGAAASFNEPRGLTADGFGNLYVADSINNTIRKVSPTGQVTTVAGLAGTVGSTDSTGDKARFNNPTSLTIDAGGNLFVADTGNNLIRKVTPAGVVTTVAGDVVNKRQGITLGGLPGTLDSPVGISHMGGNRFAVSSGNAILSLVLP